MVVSSQFAWAWLKDRPWRKAALAGLGGFAAIALLAAVRDMTELGLLMPPFGASCVLAFGFPSSPFAQPKRLIGGHLIAAMAGLLSASMFGYGLLGIHRGWARHSRDDADRHGPSAGGCQSYCGRTHTTGCIVFGGACASGSDVDCDGQQDLRGRRGAHRTSLRDNGGDMQGSLACGYTSAVGPHIAPTYLILQRRPMHKLLQGHRIWFSMIGVCSSNFTSTKNPAARPGFQSLRGSRAN